MASLTKTAKFSILNPLDTVFHCDVSAHEDKTLANSGEILPATPNKNTATIEDIEKSQKLAQEIFQILYDKFPTSNVAYVSLQERKLVGPKLGKGQKIDAPVTSKLIDTMYDEIKLSNDIQYLNQATSTVSLTYGEINDVDSMINTFRLLEEHGAFPLTTATEQKDITFYDLGSGTGRVVMAVALLGYATRCIGIEIQSSLYQTSKLVQQTYDSLLQTQTFYTPLTIPPTIELYHGSIVDPQYTVQWKEADIVFINCTCFDNDLMEQLYIVIRTMRPGSIIILLSITLPNSVQCEFLCEFRQQMSWGMADYFLYKKL